MHGVRNNSSLNITATNRNCHCMPNRDQIEKVYFFSSFKDSDGSPRALDHWQSRSSPGRLGQSGHYFTQRKPVLDYGLPGFPWMEIGNYCRWSFLDPFLVSRGLSGLLEIVDPAQHARMLRLLFWLLG